MQNTYLNLFLATLLLLAPIAGTAVATPQRQQRTSADEVKIKVAKLGTGSKARATVWLTNGTKVKGYVSQAGENDFVMRDRKTNAPTTVSYADVAKFERNNGHSTAKWVGIGVGVGAGAFLLIVLASIAALD
jgi:hypothetical protein